MMCDVKRCRSKDTELSIILDNETYSLCRRCWEASCKDESLLESLTKRRPGR